MVGKLDKKRGGGCCAVTRDKGVYQLLGCDKGERGLPVIVLRQGIKGFTSYTETREKGVYQLLY